MMRTYLSAAGGALALLAAPAFFASKTQPAAAAAPSADVETYAIDPVHSSVVFKVSHMNVASFYGRFNEVSGTITLDTKNPSASTVSVEIPTESVDTHNGKRDEHLRSSDFFSAKEFPKITFVSKTVKKTADTTYEIAGDLTVRNITKPISLRVTQSGSMKDPRGGQVLGFETTFSIKRLEYGIKYQPSALGDDVQVILAFEAKAKGASK